MVTSQAHLKRTVRKLSLQISLELAAQFVPCERPERLPGRFFTQELSGENRPEPPVPADLQNPSVRRPDQHLPDHLQRAPPVLLECNPDHS